MKQYSIYSIEDEFAEHYFYKSDILYRFFLSYEENKNRKDLSSQFHYITKRFSINNITNQLKEHLNNYTSCYIQQTKPSLIKISDTHEEITLHVEEKKIKFRCDTIQIAEKLLFPSLRNIYPYSFIIDENETNFGWISPISTRITYTNHKQVLYSYN